MILQNVFSKEKVNTGRQIEFDLLRGFTLLIIVICHVGLELGKEGTWFYYFSDIIGSEPAAPVFLILMGVSDMYSKKQNAKHYFFRGITLLLIGLLLNIIRSLPVFYIGEIDYFACIKGIFVADILMVSGLTFLLLGLFKSLKIPSYGVFIISFIFLIIGNILMVIPGCLDFSDNASLILNVFLPLDNDWCCFNLLTWFIYPAFGIVLGEQILRVKDKNKFYLMLLIVGFIGVIMLYGNIIILFPNYNSMYTGHNYYRMGVLNTFVTFIVFLFLLALWHFLGKILPNIVKHYLSFLSSYVTDFFILSWIEIVTLYHIRSYYGFHINIIQLVLIFLFVVISCSLILEIFKKMSNIKVNKKKSIT